jgi:hypothetical protein
MFFTRATDRSRDIGHWLARKRFAPTLGERNRLPVCLGLIDDHDPRTRSHRLIEVKDIAHQLLLRGHAVNRTGPITGIPDEMVGSEQDDPSPQASLVSLLEQLPA